MKFIPRRPRSRLAAASLATVLALSGLAAVAGPAAAHDGVDHDAEPGAELPSTGPTTRRSLLTKDVGEPIDLAILPGRARAAHRAQRRGPA